MLTLIQILSSYLLYTTSCEQVSLEGDFRQVTRKGCTELWGYYMLNNRSPASCGTVFEENILAEEQIIEKYVKTFLDMVVLALLNSKATYGYKILESS